MAYVAAFTAADARDDLVKINAELRREAQRRDEANMIEQGKNQQLDRNFGFLSMLGFTTTMLCTWEAVLYSNSTALGSTGPVGLLYALIYGFLGSLATCACLAELASMAPTSAGQYHWVASLAPKEYTVFLSWLTGWLSMIGWQAFVASGAYLAGSLIQALLIMNYPDFTPHRWQVTLLFLACLSVIVLVNTVLSKALPMIEGLVLIIHVLGFFAILIPMLHLSPRATAKFVFTDFQNMTGWHSDGVAWLIGLLAGVYPFLGYDGPCHMAEEVEDAARVVPWCMMITILVNGVLGLSMAIAFLFSVWDLQRALNSKTGFNFLDVFYYATDSVGGATAMASVLFFMCMFSTIALLASTSRMTWAFARDRAIPFSEFFSKVDGRSALPLRAIALSTILNVCLSFLVIGSTAAFNATVAVTVCGLSFSYFLPILLLMMKRIKGEHVKPGPFSLGKWSIPVQAFSLVFLFITSLFSFFPPKQPITASNMNYGCAMFGAALIFGVLYYYLRARKFYTGPVVERSFTTKPYQPMDFRYRSV